MTEVQEGIHLLTVMTMWHLKTIPQELWFPTDVQAGRLVLTHREHEGALAWASVTIYQRQEFLSYM